MRLIPKKIRWGYRFATSGFRSLPDFLIIGAQKSGTTSLFQYIRQHPQIHLSKIKEVHYFDGGVNPTVDNYKKGEEWYKAHFPLKLRMNKNCKTGEASPLYIFNPLVPKRIFDLIPEVKIIAVLRNPTDRAISQYFHEERREELLPIDEALRAEETRLAPILKNNNFKDKIFRKSSYKSRGRYKEQLERYLKYFPRENIYIICSEDMFSNPEAELAKLFDFLGVDKNFQVKCFKPRGVAPNRTTVSSDVYDYLDEYFYPHNKALYEFLGKNFNW